MGTGSAPAAVALLAAILLAACGQPRSEAPGETVAPETEPPVVYRCHTLTVEPGELDELRTGDTLGPMGREALQGREVFAPEDDAWLASWRVVEESEERLALLRELPEPQAVDTYDVRTHEHLVVERMGAERDADGRPPWHLRSGGWCALRRELDGLAPAGIAIDPERPPEAGSAVLHLLVNEVACASGKRADGRVRLVEAGWRDDRLLVVLGVVPQEGPQNCQGNPDTPFTVELDQPLGRRAVYDGGVHPPRLLHPAGDDG